MRKAPNLPLLDRPLDSVVMTGNGQSIDARQFLADVFHFAGLLPRGGYAINLAKDRYLFLVAFCGVIVRGACNVLPPNAQSRVLSDIAEGLAAPYLIHDGGEPASGLPSVRVSRAKASSACPEIPRIESSQLACISYTSGSTGASSAIPKSWNMLWNGAIINRQFLLDEPERPVGLVATVPSQHMYGLETTILLPLVTDLRVQPGRPVYPIEVAEALQEIAAPRVLVSTPLHLRALAESRVPFPAIDRIISATAPMTTELALEVEQQLGARLIDVFGCSEVGCIARREVARHENWRPFTPFRFQQDDKGFTTIDADHMDEPVRLQDKLEFEDPGRFRLTGRLGDQVNVGGKRASLGELSRLLLSIPGVSDGQVFEAPNESRVQRLAAVYSGTTSHSEVLHHLRQHLDPVLLPRPLIQLDQLPRNETGKLTHDALVSLYQSNRKT